MSRFFLFSFFLFLSSCAGPSVAPARDHVVEPTPERVERGRYLATHLLVCVDCHSTRDWTRFSGPLVVGSEGGGGAVFSKELGFPGTIVAPNITPHGIGRYSDGELERVITVGVTRENRALFPVMPYPHYANLCQADVDAVVAFVRTLKTIESAPPPTQLNFPMGIIVNSIPKDSARPPCPPTGEGAEVVARGRYLVDVAACIECHSPAERGQIVAGREYAGGRAFKLPTGTVTSANLTPGGPLGGYSAESFVARMRAHGATQAEAAVVDAGGMQTVMPWTMYAGLSDADLSAMFAFLQTLPKKESAPSPVWAATAAP